MLFDDIGNRCIARSFSYCRGVTFIELLVVMCLLGFLVSLALPLYRAQVIAGNRSIVVSELLTLKMRQERFYGLHRRYASSLVDLGYPASYVIDRHGTPVPPTDSKRIYRINLSTQTAGFEIAAVPQLAQVDDLNCRTLIIDALGVRRISGAGVLEKCW